jgi:hypothetical protein
LLEDSYGIPQIKIRRRVWFIGLQGEDKVGRKTNLEGVSENLAQSFVVLSTAASRSMAVAHQIQMEDYPMAGGVIVARRRAAWLAKVLLGFIQDHLGSFDDDDLQSNPPLHAAFRAGSVKLHF